MGNLTPIKDLPVELLLEIFSYLPPKDLVKVSSACKGWHALSQDKYLWSLVLPSLTVIGNAFADMSIKEKCIKQLQAHERFRKEEGSVTSLRNKARHGRRQVIATAFHDQQRLICLNVLPSNNTHVHFYHRSLQTFEKIGEIPEVIKTCVGNGKTLIALPKQNGGKLYKFTEGEDEGFVPFNVDIFHMGSNVERIALQGTLLACWPLQYGPEEAFARVVIVDLTTMRQIDLKGASYILNCLIWDEEQILVCEGVHAQAKSGTLYLHNMRTGTKEKLFHVSSSLQAKLDDEILVCASSNGLIRCWNLYHLEKPIREIYLGFNLLQMEVLNSGTIALLVEMQNKLSRDKAAYLYPVILELESQKTSIGSKIEWTGPDAEHSPLLNLRGGAFVLPEIVPQESAVFSRIHSFAVESHALKKAYIPKTRTQQSCEII